MIYPKSVRKWLSGLIYTIGEKQIGENRAEVWKAIDEDMKRVYREGIEERKENTIYSVETPIGKIYYCFHLVVYKDIMYHNMAFYKSLNLLKISKFLRK